MIGLLGRGGMGEVYRADDLMLSHPVALKFLSKSLSASEDAQERFLNEVRIARQVSHPNVCRVYDVGVLEGLLYLSMEYVDGENLASLLRRIGRVPSDKAIEIARKICAGLAAAHDKGVVHRDLKPANIMIDGRGEVLITDFGLAGLAGELEGSEIRNGTLGYMSPEQLAGTGVSRRSDIYSLGVVLYEMFTGNRAFDAETRETLLDLQKHISLKSPTLLVKDLDPAVERVILRCLQPEPGGRPSSALTVAAGLPGGDPLLAILAAGETPSPELVAAAGAQSGLRTGTAVACLIALFLGLIAVLVLSRKSGLIEKAHPGTPPSVLAARAREILERVGYGDQPVDREFSFAYNPDYFVMEVDGLRADSKHEKQPAGLWTDPPRSRTPLLGFFYRESPDYMEPAGSLGTLFPRPTVVTNDDPPFMISGMARLFTDTEGRLLWLDVVPPQLDKSPLRLGQTNWAALFVAAGLDISRFSASAPEWASEVMCDEQAAWTGPSPDSPGEALRIEAGAWRGRPVAFRLIWPWTRATRMDLNRRPIKATVGRAVFWVLLLVSLIASALLARRNTLRGRGDPRGAFRLALFSFIVTEISWLLGATHVATIAEFRLFLTSLRSSISLAVFVWLFYLGLEPYVRKRWPQALISWSRVIGGGITDPLVGGDVLIGILAGIVCVLLVQVNVIVNLRLGRLSAFTFTAPLLGPGHALSGALGILHATVWMALGYLVVLFVLRTLLRRQWMAAVIFIIAATAVGLGPSLRAVDFLFGGLVGTILVLLFFRFGLLSAIAGWFVFNLLLLLPITSDLSAWYAGSTYLALTTTAGLGLYGFRTTLAGRPLLREEFFQR